MSMKTSQESFQARLEHNMNDAFMRKAVANAQTRMFSGRAKAAEELGHWEQWREMGATIRDHVLENLDYYLEQLSDNVEKNGGHVFFAKDAAQAQHYISEVIQRKKARKIVKSKSMVSEEISLNQLLQAQGCEVLETDLGEYILQLAEDAPSHIVVPALHKNRQQIQQLLQHKLGYSGSDTPEEMTRFVREKMRSHFLEADVGITGCNFAVAQSGTVALVTNEGNARFATTLPKTHIAVMGMERVVPTFKELDIVLSLLCRSAVGQPLTSYITALTGPRENDQIDGPEDFHLVIIDNGRSSILGSEFRPILRCIRCAACINTCPAYRHIGGHSYGSIYPGPIGAVLSPLLGGYDDYHELPYACSLCKGCNEVCPVKIPLAELLLKHRQKIAESKQTTLGERATVGFFNYVNAHPKLWDKSVKGGARIATKVIHEGKSKVNVGAVKLWSQSRDLPEPEGQSFRSWFKQHQRKQQ
ncbi:LutB/LldF family L-lactate oxidation iron-sulfur protein [Celerinatantimonas diazotrophica]|uniref:L-lactate dehydrogenase complex protein LldF n=1 Tax=Celerinatantimonas diazotrophica TaxID=412034 RepID=A0A4R1J8P6_9GAMM|nr:LutB/LldF family L-lactate oxidation iron-sulfur protein [Celerinatantimonas diazotrophica]TCK46416.1 L-lactate dehydrogenase complex protein LldF [Celerinatantimonas diazotrophica]CAG9295207.1 Lactate utilization protein B [Celerinatantimonas diazotrophica]